MSSWVKSTRLTGTVQTMAHWILLRLCVLLCVYNVVDANIAIDVGRHVIFSYPGSTVPTQLIALVKQGHVGGVILFGENIDSNLTHNLASLQTAYRSSPAYNSAPLLILTDQEGGQVRRLRGGPVLSEKQIGASSNPSLAASKAGQDAASTLKSAGLNVNLAPVVDVYRQAGDFDDQFQRSYSSNATVAATCGRAFVQAQESANVIATAKHFPGLGTASADENTDLKPVTLNVTLGNLRSIDEAPFQSVIAAGVDMIMMSWAVYPALDAQSPAGLSKKWIKNELRSRLGFKGVTISDAIEAGALEAYGSNSNRALKAVLAGMDVVLASARNVSQGEGIVQKLINAVESGNISETEFQTSTARIVAMQQRLTRRQHVHLSGS